MICKLNERLGLCNKLLGAGNEFLCRLFCIFCKPKVQRDSGEGQVSANDIRLKEMNKLLNAARGGGKKKSFNLGLCLRIAEGVLANFAASVGVIKLAVQSSSLIC